MFQVSYDISGDKTRKREIRGALLGSKTTGCDNIYIITNQERESIEIKDKKINVLPAYEWLLK